MFEFALDVGQYVEFDYEFEGKQEHFKALARRMILDTVTNYPSNDKVWLLEITDLETANIRFLVLQHIKNIKKF